MLKETTRISPAGESAEQKLPLTLFDLWWIHVNPTRRLIFYDHPCSKPEFLDIVVPKLKQSLSLTLKHYLPAAGTLLYPLNTDEKPMFRYVSGDSVPLTIAESSRGFDEMTGNDARDADQFYDFMPQLPAATEEPGYKVVTLLALQVTHFPGRGVSIGVVNSHSLGDARSIVGFMSAWASINKSGEFLTGKGESPPIFDRSVVKDSAGIDKILWNVVKHIPLNPSPPPPTPTNRVRSTFILRKSDLQKLKNLIPASSFVVATAYTWSCLAKSADAVGDKTDEKTDEVFFLSADARGRSNAMFNPPVPVNYFGNCLGGGMVVIEHGKLAAEEGFATAAQAIAEEIKIRVQNKDEFLKGAENWPAGMQKYMGKSSFWVTDSPRFDLYGADFGWGKARKVEVVSIDGEKYSMALCNSRDDDGGVEIGMSLHRERMEAYASIFAKGLMRDQTGPK